MTIRVIPKYKDKYYTATNKIQAKILVYLRLIFGDGRIVCQSEKITQQ
jgi:hypothetical protein